MDRSEEVEPGPRQWWRPMKLAIDFTDRIHGKPWAECSRTERDEALLAARVLGTADGQKLMQWLGATTITDMADVPAEKAEFARGRQSVFWSLCAMVKTAKGVEEQGAQVDE